MFPPTPPPPSWINTTDFSDFFLLPPCPLSPSAPQHPSSLVLHTIPPRAPSRSTRSNILSYTLHLATTARLTSYSSPSGSASLLHRAEAGDKIDSVDEDWLAKEQHAEGLYKVSINLLKSKEHAQEGLLPLSVERRASLARLVEEMLSNPSKELAIVKVAEGEAKDSNQVASLNALAPLTSPDTTILYTSIVPSARSTTSVAQSLIDLKFGNSAEDEAASSLALLLTSEPSSHNKRPPPNPHDSPSSSSTSTSGVASTSRQSESVFARSSQLTTEPHMDYRIVRGQAMRSRAKLIFSTSILPALETAWCRRHRVNDCQVCQVLVVGFEEELKPGGRKSKRSLPGQGLGSRGGSLGDVLGRGGRQGSRTEGEKAPLVGLVPSFIIFSATLLRDLRDRANGTLQTDGDDYLGGTSINPNPNATPSASLISVTAQWYALFHSLLIQACLEGYLVDGWTGTTGIEVLFGCGCGVWEGRGWSRTTGLRKPSSDFAKSNAGEAEASGSEDEEEEEEGEESENEETLGREKEGREAVLVEAAQTIFGSRDVAQADFERNMRDRIHEVSFFSSSSFFLWIHADCFWSVNSSSMFPRKRLFKFISND